MNKRSYYPFLVHCYYGKPGAGKSYYEMKQELKRFKESEEYHRKGFVELHKRIDKAIEFIEKYQIERKVKIGNVELDKSFVNSQGVLDILKGEDKE